MTWRRLQRSFSGKRSTWRRWRSSNPRSRNGIVVPQAVWLGSNASLNLQSRGPRRFPRSWLLPQKSFNGRRSTKLQVRIDSPRFLHGGNLRALPMQLAAGKVVAPAATPSWTPRSFNSCRCTSRRSPSCTSEMDPTLERRQQQLELRSRSKHSPDHRASARWKQWRHQVSFIALGARIS